MSQRLKLDFDKTNKHLDSYTLTLRNIKYASLSKTDNNEAKLAINVSSNSKDIVYSLKGELLINDCRKVFDTYSFHADSINYYHYKKSEYSIDELVIRGIQKHEESTKHTFCIGEEILVKFSILPVSEKCEIHAASQDDETLITRKKKHRRKRNKSKRNENNVTELSKDTIDYLTEQYNKFKPTSKYNNFSKPNINKNPQEITVPYTVSWSAAHPFQGGTPQ